MSQSLLGIFAQVHKVTVSPYFKNFRIEPLGKHKEVHWQKKMPRWHKGVQKNLMYPHLSLDQVLKKSEPIQKKYY